MTKTTYKSCPLCKKRNAIKFIYSDTTYESRPGPKDLIGNYNIIPGSTQCDYGHAEDCPKLIGVIDKQNLLKYFTTGSCGGYSTRQSYEEIKKVLDQIGLSLKVEITPMNSKPLIRGVICLTSRLNDSPYWHTAVFLRDDSNNRFFEIESQDKDHAWSLILQRMICGEIITVNGKRLQFLQSRDDKFSINFL